MATADAQTLLSKALECWRLVLSTFAKRCQTKRSKKLERLEPSACVCTRSPLFSNPSVHVFLFLFKKREMFLLHPTLHMRVHIYHTCWVWEGTTLFVWQFQTQNLEIPNLCCPYINLLLVPYMLIIFADANFCKCAFRGMFLGNY